MRYKITKSGRAVPEMMRTRPVHEAPVPPRQWPQPPRQWRLPPRPWPEPPAGLPVRVRLTVQQCEAFCRQQDEIWRWLTERGGKRMVRSQYYDESGRCHACLYLADEDTAFEFKIRWA